MNAPCPFCRAPHGFHEDTCGAGPLPAHLRHLLRPLSSENKQAAGSRTRPSEEEIARLRAAKGRPLRTAWNPDKLAWKGSLTGRRRKPSSTTRERKRLTDRGDPYECWYCGQSGIRPITQRPYVEPESRADIGLTVEHQPSRTHTVVNRTRAAVRVVWACRPCNQNKGVWTGLLLAAGT